MTDNNAASHGGAMGHYLRIHDDYDLIRAHERNEHGAEGW